MTFKELLIAALGASIDSIGEAELESELQKLHDTSPTAYAEAIEGGNLFCTVMKPLLAKSPVGTIIIIGIQEAITASAAANGVSLAAPATESTDHGVGA